MRSEQRKKSQCVASAVRASAGGSVVGAALGALAGPIPAVIGAAVGVVVALGGCALACIIDSTGRDRLWRGGGEVERPWEEIRDAWRRFRVRDPFERSQ